MAAKKVLFIVGSFRKKSFNQTLAHEAAKLLPEGVEAEFLDYADVPFMSQDDEFPPPESVTRAREAVSAAAGVWMVTPQYNHAMPARIKNVIDWLSRPLTPNGPRNELPLVKKPVIISGVAGGQAAAGSRAALAALLKFLNADLIGEDGEGFSVPPETWATGEYTPSEEDLARVKAQGEKLVEALG